jgi:tRNA-2-methylthio-N6-dimethylallyladenosine synthase/ribosomal protein S12 methylthiotransferase
VLPAPRPENARLLSTGPAYAWLKVSDGCRHACTFCTIPAIRGPLVSVPAAVLQREALLLLKSGVKELILVAQDLTSWGRDLGPEHSLRELLEILLPLPGLQRLRLMYLYPGGLSRELLRFLKDAGPPFVPYFDVPLQHAARNVLTRMGRPFAGDPRESLDRIRAFFPEAALRTSLIAGFPGESGADFDALCSFVEKARFHHLGVFVYQKEEGTPAADMPDQIPAWEKERRRAALMALQREISAAILAQYAGQRLSILVDAPQGEWPGLHVGRAWFQAPENDGVTYVSGPGVFPGALVEAEITSCADYDLVALTDEG